ncbi:hypothetical protein ARMSODRAFT_979411 [Armillaria solidipes]|uniref:Uncharacterized protein n=1 Tax=Armillaria solidipes TaxID=1076256 RepID=A0A2H3BAI3_9AGAR|nr:hypothetical protein ARMSODRAFT_979411 [Armillaria solidipes]
MCRRRHVRNVYLRCGHTVNLSLSSQELQTANSSADLLAVPSLSQAVLYEDSSDLSSNFLVFYVDICESPQHQRALSLLLPGNVRPRLLDSAESDLVPDRASIELIEIIDRGIGVNFSGTLGHTKKGRPSPWVDLGPSQVCLPQTVTSPGPNPPSSLLAYAPSLLFKQANFYLRGEKAIAR